jgi:hypothetical protein
MKSFLWLLVNMTWKNTNNVSPRSVNRTTKKLFELECNLCGYEFKTSGCKFVGCPHCNGKDLCDEPLCLLCYNNSMVSDKDAPRWDYEKNEKINMRATTKHSGTKYHFKCYTCNHSYPRPANSQTGCPYCNGDALCDDEKCQWCFENSLASHPKIIHWSKQNNIAPRKVRKYSSLTYLVDCDVCYHTFPIVAGRMTVGNWCGFCWGSRLCDEIMCFICFNRSFASHPKAWYWSVLNTCSPRDIAKATDKKYLFDCLDCFHPFLKSPNKIKNDSWCGYCAHQLLCDEMMCLICFNNSFLSSGRAHEWSTLNEKSPRDVFKFSNLKYKLICSKCTSGFEITLSSASQFINSGCQTCIHKTEKKVYDYLIDFYPDLITQATFDWCKLKMRLRFDMFIPSLMTLIEIDGGQHFKEVKFFKGNILEVTQMKDRMKDTKAIENKYNMIRITQNDIWCERFQWRNLLIDTLQEIKTNKISSQIYYFSTSDCYEKIQQTQSITEIDRDQV